MDPLTDLGIRSQISQAWRDSRPDDPAGRHEEGGYFVLNPDGSHGIERWPAGGPSGIGAPPLDAKNCYNGKAVVAAFHTHPNPPIDESGREWEQGPSQSDRRWHVRRRLVGFVFSRALVYEIDVNGNVRVIGKREELLAT